VEGGYEEVQSHTLPTAAFATANIDTDSLGNRANSHQLSIDELLN
jgi:hypothetical protein